MQNNESEKCNEQQSRKKHYGQRPPHVLLIEDDDEMRNMLAEALTQEGYRVTERNEALDWLLACIHNSAKDTSSSPNNSFDVVVSDIRMPKMGGLDALRIINDINCADVCPPTIFITAFGDEETHQMARTLGAFYVLDKPFDISRLIDKLKEAISS